MPQGPGEREFEIGRDEAWFANVKRTYDEYQQESLESIRRSRVYVDKVLSDAQGHDNERQVIANRALSDAVDVAGKQRTNSAETDNMVAKQTLRHGDIAIDRQWNLDEQAWIVSKLQPAMDAIAASLAAKIADALGNSGGNSE